MQVTYIDHMGDDLSICNTARISFARKANDFSAEQNERLIKYLAKHKHWTPFSHAYISLAMTAPIAIKAQCDKHTVGFTSNTESRRYISDTPELFVPTFRAKPTGSIKQGSGDEHPKNRTWLTEYKRKCLDAIDLYERMIADGVAPEQARFVLPQGVYTNWVWTGSLYAWARFYNQRADSHAQKEIQELAKQVGGIIEPLFPIGWNALVGEKA